MGVYGRSKPYPTQPPKTYTCKRCGCLRSDKGRKTAGCCLDCTNYARADGWI